MKWKAGEAGMIKEYIVSITDDVDPSGFERFENDYSPEQELIRCKYCKWGEPTKNAFGEDRIICGNDDTYIDRYITVPADWFCADGEIRNSMGS